MGGDLGPRADAGGVLVELLGPGDEARMRSIRLAALADAPRAFGSTLAEELAFDDARWSDRLAGGSLSAVGVVDGQDVGLVGCGAFSDHPDVAVLVSMWVHPDHRGRGVADALVETAVSWAAAQGLAEVRLDVADENTRAIGFYQRMGFRATGATAVLRHDPSITEREMSRSTEDDG